MPEEVGGKGIEALTLILSALDSLPEEERERVIRAVGSYYGISLSSTGRAGQSRTGPTSGGTSRVEFSEDLALSPKDFLVDKQPRTDVERIACLAFYLTHYRNTPYFKTIDLSTLNTEAAQPKFANATVSANNALKTGYLAPAGKGTRQLSAAGEQFVRALPDRDAARQAMDSIHRRRRGRKTVTTSATDASTENTTES